MATPGDIQERSVFTRAEIEQFGTSEHEARVARLRSQLTELDLRRARFPRGSDEHKRYSNEIAAVDAELQRAEAALRKQQSEDAAVRDSTASLAGFGLALLLGFGLALLVLGFSWWLLGGAGLGAFLAFCGWAGTTS